MSIHLTIEKEAISSNHKIYGANKQGSRWGYKKLREELVEEITKKIGEGKEADRVALKITRHWGPKKRLFDEANLIGGFKILIDAFVRTGHLKDDDPNHFKGYYFQQKSETGFGYIEVKELAPYEELRTALEKVSEQMEVTGETLIKAGLESQLIKS